MSEAYEACMICRSPSPRSLGDGGPIVSCCRCVLYSVKEDWKLLLSKLNLNSEKRVTLASKWIREHPGEYLQADALLPQLEKKLPSVGEKAENLLQQLGLIAPKPGATIYIPMVESIRHVILDTSPQQEFTLQKSQVEAIELAFNLQGASCAQNFTELYYLLNEYLTLEKGYLLNLGANKFKISPAGWAHLDEMGRPTDSIQVFVAMMFSSETDKLWSAGIRKGILDAGYKPFRIDKHDHNNRIDDEIIASIKRSKFLVADFTGQRGGVYFEAGYALGLGQQVIWLCRKDALNEVHFDTRQYNHITWESDKLPELARALTLRIEATIGHGSYRE